MPHQHPSPLARAAQPGNPSGQCAVFKALGFLEDPVLSYGRGTAIDHNLHCWALRGDGAGMGVWLGPAVLAVQA